MTTPLNREPNWRERHRTVLSFCLVMWFAGVVVASVLPYPVLVVASVLPYPVLMGALPPIAEKLGHAIFYAVLTLLLRLVVDRGWSCVHAPGLSVVIGIALEAVQLHVPGRSADWSDVLWNLLGAVLGAVTAEWILSTGQK